MGLKTGIVQGIYHQLPDAGVVFYQIDHKKPPDVEGQILLFYIVAWKI
jgi:hypothetical protein